MDQTSETEKVYQKQKYDEIIEILLTAGYFRARINNLTEFDKVVGGLCWCITMSGEDVDVDILFQENSTIGQRITLSEAIVKALRKMNCPSPLQPHQIQGGVGGSDFPALHPVIVWLIKKFFERRVEIEAKMRSFSLLQFTKNYAIPFETKVDEGTPLELQRIISKSKATRTYKRRELKGASEETRVHACLIEYGETIASKNFDGKGNSAFQIPISDSEDVSLSLAAGSSNSADLSGFEKKLAQAAKDAQKEEQMYAEQYSRAEAELLKQMSELRGEDGSLISGSQVGGLLGLQSSDISFAAAAYQAELDEAKRLVDESLASGKLGQAASYKRQKEMLLKQREEVSQKSAVVKQSYKIAFEKLKLSEDEKADAVEYIQQLRAQVAKLSQLEANSSQKAELATLKKYIMLNEQLKRQESSFKLSCKAQLEDLNKKIASSTQSDDENSEENQRFKEIEEMHSKVMTKYNRLRQLLAQTNLEVANTARTIDDIPTRTELIQYERRFAELYQQVAWKLEENRKYYDMYNILETSLSFVQKEVKLLNSISENFNEAMRNPVLKTEFLQQFEKIVKGVDVST